MTTAPLTPSASLHVSDLHTDVTDAELYNLFKAIGPVVNVRICRDSITQQSLGHGYVNFTSASDAESAIEKLNFTKLHAVPIRVEWIRRDPISKAESNVFIKNLSPEIDTKQLHGTFSQFGTIISCKISYDTQGRSRGFGFVQFEDEEAANRAIEQVNGKIIAGRSVFVGPFIPKTERGGKSPEDVFTNCYIKNLPETYTEEKLNDLFRSFGEILSARVMIDKQSNSKGFGFVNFTEHESAVAACIALNGTDLDGQELFVGRAMSKEERLKVNQENYHKMVEENWIGKNLYVKFLDSEVTDEILRSEFDKFGTITSATVMRNKTTGASKGFGFVCFETEGEAQRALSEMNGHVLMGKPLYVSFAERRAERRMKIQTQMAQRGFFGVRGTTEPIRGISNGVTRGTVPNVTSSRTRTVPTRQRRVTSQPPKTMTTKMTRGIPTRGIPTRGIPTRGIPTRGIQRTAQSRATTFIQQLQQLDPASQKKVLGDRLFPFIEQRHPGLGRKITGMLMDLDVQELLKLLQDRQALISRINEAVSMLQR